MAIFLRYRNNNKDGRAVISVRCKINGRDNSYALGVSVEMKRWNLINQTIKNARLAQKQGASIFIEDKLTTQIWTLLQELIQREKAGTLSESDVPELVQSIIRPEESASIKNFREQISEPVARKTTFADFLSQYINDLESGSRLKQKSTRKVAASTIKGYKGFIAQLQAYQHARHCIIDWDDLTIDFYKDFKQYLIAKNYSPNTIARHVKTMKTILYAAKAMHLTTRDDFTSTQWSADREDVDNIYISTERLAEMAAFDMSDYEVMKERAVKFSSSEKERNTLTHALKRDLYRRKLAEARDIFVLGCLTGQRVSDYKRISLNMIETIIGDRRFIHLQQVKTGKDVYIPCSPMIAEILKRYPAGLPNIYDQHLNERIKVVGLLLGWTEPAGLNERRGLLSYRSSKRFCDAIKTHTARRSFATNAYKAGVPLSAIMAVTGHSSEEMLKRYLKLGSKERALLAAAEFDKLAL